MARINYEFTLGQWEEVEVSEEFKKEYEFMRVREKAKYWKAVKQKQRAGIPTAHDWSLSKMLDEGIDYVSKDNLEEEIIQKEERTERLNKLLGCLTGKQKEVYILNRKGLTQRMIAKRLNLSLGTVNERLQNATKNIFNYFFKNPNI